MGRRNGWRHAARASTALRPIPIVLLATALPSFARAQAANAQGDMANMVFADPQGVMGISVAVALGVFATVATLLHLAGRKAWIEREAELSAELTDVRARLDRAQVFLASETQIVIAWGAPDAEPEIEGDIALLADSPVARRVLGFGSWLAPQAAQQLEGHVERLRLRGEAFRMPLQSASGRHLEAEGRAVSGRAVMRIRDVSGDRLELTRLRERHVGVTTQLESFQAMLDAAPGPAWLRDQDGRLVWINAAYLRATEAQGRDDALSRQAELLDLSAREDAARARGRHEVWCARVPAVVAGQRHMLEVVDLPAPGGSVGFATDVSEVEDMRADLGRQMDAHARTLDQLSTAVAIFDRHRKLVFHNSAYRHLWSLDVAFLDQYPQDGEILDRLRAEGRLPEQADFRSWKAGLMAAYQSVETSEHVWYLPDGRTLRTVVNPNPQGGVTYLFDDVTERFHLESRYNALIRVQGETLDSLKEGVAVFGTDGRLKLFNPAFAHLWHCEATALADRPHFDQVVALCRGLHDVEADWNDLRSIVAGLHDQRTGLERRLARRDGSIIDCVTAPLPDGATLLTLTDVSAGVNVERALTERNQALIDAEKLRNDFVHHVSYELRSPLTNIIGFIQLLGDGAVGPLNPKQREYTGYVLKSSAALLAIINDILDLASIDTDAMELSLGDVDIVETIAAASEGLQDRLAESNIHLNIVAMDGIGAFRADAKRIRQILFNLLSNAIGFSEPGQTVTLAALRRPGEVVFKVSDEGRGIPLEVLDHVFDRFHTHTIGSRHRGVGLGLAIVRSFVELHGGEVHIESAPGEGTIVTCVFPANGVRVEKAAFA
ncbi:MAG: PAS-domain containing protein [Beijerinckiaceae bacterium]|nr:PAS-domain containing protein [Beijerinckiaceae bacterium]